MGILARIGRKAKKRKRADAIWGPPLEKHAIGGSAFRVGDISDDVANGLELFSFFIGNFDIEFFFEGHDELDGIERVCAEIFDEFGFGGDLIRVDAKLVNDDIFYTGFDTFI